MGQLTVKELAAMLAEAVRGGYGDKKIVISDDNEGNGYHGLFYGLTVNDIESVAGGMIYDSQETNPEKLVILG